MSSVANIELDEYDEVSKNSGQHSRQCRSGHVKEP